MAQYCTAQYSITLRAAANRVDVGGLHIICSPMKYLAPATTAHRHSPDCASQGFVKGEDGAWDGADARVTRDVVVA